MRHLKKTAALSRRSQHLGQISTKDFLGSKISSALEETPSQADTDFGGWHVKAAIG